MPYFDKERKQMEWLDRARKACVTHYVVVADDSSYVYYTMHVLEDQKVADVLTRCSIQKLRVVEVIAVPWPTGPRPVVGTHLYVSPRDYRSAGKATIKSAWPSISGGKPTWFVKFDEVSGEFNYEILLQEQKRLKEHYGDQIAGEDSAPF